jgi:hypothetical protein
MPHLEQLARLGGCLFVALVAADELTTAMGYWHGLSETTGIYLALAAWLHLSVGVVLLLTAMPKLALAWGIAGTWRWLLRQSGTRLDRVLVLAGLGACCGGYAAVVARNAVLILHAVR